MTAPHDVRQISVSIAREWRAVYGFANRPQNVTQWAAGLGAALTRDGDDWIALGPVAVRFSPGNSYGVLDH